MSLISDALKEAQRERTGRIPPRSNPATIGESFFPYPSTKQQQPARRALIVGTVGLLVVVLGAVTVYRINAGRSVRRTPVIASASRPQQSVTRAAATLPPVQPISPSSTAENLKSSPPKVPQSPPAQSPVVTRRADVASAPVRPEIPAAKPSEEPGRTQTPVAEPVREPVSVPKSAAANDVRVVMDPRGLRPGDSLFARAYAEHRRGNLEGAVDLYERALRQPPVSPELYNNYGALLAMRGDDNAAILLYKRGIAANADDPRLWINIGDSYRKIGRRAEALSSFFQAAKLDPSNVAVKIRLAGEYQAIGDTAAARRGFEEAVKIAPKNAEAHYYFGGFLQSQRDYRGAANELQLFVDLAGDAFPPQTIDDTKRHITNLRRQFP